ncbi:MAG: acetyl-CoA carboxylase, carboxyltransferase subunit beta [Oscillospiraceae bacterium]|jgi:acetyl-CoA carboxylase carboxyl transferase subunit beta|nr:acetyl-CoA carboxylase, carboxyltransferase subunit beta [Oscillospiraceae bacterium]
MGLEDMLNLVKTRFNGTEKTVENTKVKEEKINIPPDVFYKCPRCQETTLVEDFLSQGKVCKCGYHGRMTAKERLMITADKESFVEYDRNMVSLNPIDFPKYEEKVAELQEQTGLKEAVITGECTIRNNKCVVGIMDSNFMMASMGSVVGEKITRAFEKATEKKLPVIMFTASGGARMQEGIISLMQMAKTSGAVKRHNDAGLLYIVVITDPTTGGVTASFASLGDIIIAEPKVMFGFAGRRVIQDTIRQKLPDNFQMSEMLLEKGFVDIIVERKKMRSVLSNLLRLHSVD